MRRRACECSRWCKPNGIRKDYPDPCSCACHADHRRAVLSVYRSIQALGKGIINTYDQQVVAGGDRIVITFTPHGPTHPGSGWHVGRCKDGVWYKTDKGGAWYDRNMKAFPHFTGKESKETARLEAVAWVAAKYGPRDFVRNAQGDYVEREVQELYPIKRRR